MHDLIVVSDLHLGRGKNRATGRFHSLETFFYDEDLRNFFRSLCVDAGDRRTPFKLVLNGDVFDLLRFDSEGAAPVAIDPPTAAAMVAQILEGHPVFVDAIAEVLSSGYEVIILPGNHDIEVQWAPVQEVIQRAVLARMPARQDEQARLAATARLSFRPWFFHEPGRVWIEHGCQYDPECSFRSFLRGGLAASPRAGEEVERDLPLGSFFQRFLYNAFGPITFIVPSTRANLRYIKWLLFNEPRLLARVLWSHLPFAWRLLGRMAKQAGDRTPGELEAVHQQELDALVQSSELGEKLLLVDALKNTKGMDHTVRELTRQGLIIFGSALLGGSVILALFFLGYQAITQMSVWFGLRTLLFVALSFILLVAPAAGLLFALLRPPSAPSLRPLRRAAVKLAEMLDVSIVTFGHTHDEAIMRLARPSSAPGWYFNTGTWISVFSHDVLAPRDRNQFTFLRIRGHEGELLHWSPARAQPLPVILLDEPEGLMHRTAREVWQEHEPAR